jgi:hypothetical protein
MRSLLPSQVWKSLHNPQRINGGSHHLLNNKIGFLTPSPLQNHINNSLKWIYKVVLLSWHAIGAFHHGGCWGGHQYFVLVIPPSGSYLPVTPGLLLPQDEAPIADRFLPPAPLAAAPSLPHHRSSLPSSPRRRPLKPTRALLPGARRQVHPARAPACLADRRRPPALSSTRSTEGPRPLISATKFGTLVTGRAIPRHHKLCRLAVDLLCPAPSPIRHTTIVVIHCLTMVSTPVASSPSSLLFVPSSAPLARRSASVSIEQSRRRPWEHAPKSLQKGPPKIM